MIIALDGPAASGKGTLARKLAAHYGLRYLDTGSLYRAVAWSVLDKGQDPADEAAALHAAQNLDLSQIDDADLRTIDVGHAASIVAVMPEVRAAILSFQREFANHQPGAVLDGRDIGTVVCPEADAKLFVTASIEARALRRYLELKASGSDVDEAHVLQTLSERDARDAAREIAPMIKAEDAHLLDTSNLDIESAFQAAVEHIDRCL